MERTLFEFFQSNPVIGALMALVGVWLVKKMVEQRERQIGELSASVKNATLAMTKLSYQIEHLDKTIFTLRGDVDANKKSLDTLHEKVRDLREEQLVLKAATTKEK